jgi:transitional endoplasmic reticulum ATPase
VPDVKWEDVGGLANVKRQLIEAVEWPLKHADLFIPAAVKLPKGILLGGLPGCGKNVTRKGRCKSKRVQLHRRARPSPPVQVRR